MAKRAQFAHTVGSPLVNYSLQHGVAVTVHGRIKHRFWLRHWVRRTRNRTKTIPQSWLRGAHAGS